VGVVPVIHSAVERSSHQTALHPVAGHVEAPPLPAAVVDAVQLHVAPEHAWEHVARAEVSHQPEVQERVGVVDRFPTGLRGETAAPNQRTHLNIERSVHMQAIEGCQGVELLGCSAPSELQVAAECVVTHRQVSLSTLYEHHGVMVVYHHCLEGAAGGSWLLWATPSLRDSPLALPVPLLIARGLLVS
ncbi:hypothetical protein ANANG_G00184980, partial [Anguilla anguilla]